jgi:hypothetical protein
MVVVIGPGEASAQAQKAPEASGVEEPNAPSDSSANAQRAIMLYIRPGGGFHVRQRAGGMCYESDKV